MTEIAPGGYDVATFEGRRADPVVTTWKQGFGPDSDTASDTPDGLIIDILTKMAQAVDERGAEAFAAAFFTTAKGLQLDQLLQPFFGSERAPDRGTTGGAIVYGDIDTVIPAGSLVSSTGRGDVFNVNLPVQVVYSTIAVSIFGPAPGAPTFPQISISGQDYPTLAGITGTGLDVANAQRANMPDSDDRILAIHGPFEDPAGNGVMVIELTGFLNVVSQASASDATDLRGAKAQITSQEPGPIAGDALSITTITTPIAGWAGVVNIEALTLGATEDTDAQYRQRHLDTLGKNGGGTVLSLLGQLRDVRNNPGVEFVEVYDNPSTFTDINGLPPHSYEAVVEGGTDENIVRIIWEDFQRGVDSFGQLEFFIEDSRAAGVHRIRFSRPVKRYIWCEVDIVSGEGFPPEEISNIKDAVATDLFNFGVTLGVGRDIYIDELKQQVSVPGSESITIRLGDQPDPLDPEPTLIVSNIYISSRELGIWDLGKIKVNIT